MKIAIIGIFFLAIFLIYENEKKHENFHPYALYFVKLVVLWTLTWCLDPHVVHLLDMDNDFVTWCVDSFDDELLILLISFMFVKKQSWKLF
jgi:hypothetical protein